MQAAVLHQLGEAPAVVDRPDPVPAERRSVVRVTAAPVVPLDLLCAGGTSYFGRPAVPYVPGVQGVGVVEQSTLLPVGSRVFLTTTAGMAPGDGSLAELCLVADSDLVPLDTGVPDEQVAALGLSAVAAWMALAWRAGLQAGEDVLVLGGGGVVGQTGIGAAKALGARRVVATARSQSSRRAALAAGADEVVEMADDADELTRRLAAATGGSVDVVLDPVFGVAATAACRVLAPGGRLVNLGGAAGDEAVLSSAVLRSRSASVLGYTNNALTPQQRADAVSAVLRQAEEGTVRTTYATRPLSDVAAVWREQGAGGSPRVVLLP